MIITTNLAMNYGTKILFTDVNVHIKNGNRYGLVGANGAGKSMFFKILLQEEEASIGEFTCVKNHSTLQFL